MHTRISVVMIFALLLAGLLLAGCQGNSEIVEVGAAQNGKTIELEQGQVLVVTLESNITTGHSWVPADLAQAALEQDGESLYAEPAGSKGRVGAGGQETLRFKAVKAGQGTLKLEYRQPWDKESEPAEVYTLDIVVQ